MERGLEEIENELGSLQEAYINEEDELLLRKIERKFVLLKPPRLMDS